MPFGRLWWFRQYDRAKMQKSGQFALQTHDIDDPTMLH
jgi:hypothetical protein